MPSSLRILPLLALLLLAAPAARADAAAAAVTPAADAGAAAPLQLALEQMLPWALNLRLQDLQPQGWSAAPFLGRDDKNGMVYGAGLFFYRDLKIGYNLSLYGVTNLGDFNSVTVVHEHWLPGPWRYGTTTTLERTFDYYYGEGDLTSRNDPFRIRMDHLAFQGRALYRLWDEWSLGAAIDWRRRTELDVERTGVPQASDPVRLFPDESGGALDLLAQQDSRDSKLFPSSGHFSQVLLRWVPSAWASLPQDEGLTQAEAETRAYQSLWPGCVLALRAMGAASWGDPSYLWRYRLGGVDVLRGYGDDRFRGQDYWAGQAELRFPIYKIITGACGADAGDAASPDFHGPRGTVQAGLRLALPPDWGQRARFDVGLAPDQWTLNVQFGEVF